MTANYYLMITELSKIQLTQDDYGDKKKVKLSNRAAKTLQGIEKEMRKDLSRDKTRGECIDILDRLLDHEDDRVKINAGNFCLQEGVLTGKAWAALKSVADLSEDKTLRLSAAMVMQNHGGENPFPVILIPHETKSSLGFMAEAAFMQFLRAQPMPSSSRMWFSMRISASTSSFAALSSRCGSALRQ